MIPLEDGQYRQCTDRPASDGVPPQCDHGQRAEVERAALLRVL